MFVQQSREREIHLYKVTQPIAMAANTSLEILVYFHTLIMAEHSNIPEYKLRRKGAEEIPFKIEELEANAGYNPTAPHKHNYYEIFFFCKSGGRHMVDFHEMEIVANQLHILSPGQVHYMHREPETT